MVPIHVRILEVFVTHEPGGTANTEHRTPNTEHRTPNIERLRAGTSRGPLIVASRAIAPVPGDNPSATANANKILSTMYRRSVCQRRRRVSRRE